MEQVWSWIFWTRPNVLQGWPGCPRVFGLQNSDLHMINQFLQDLRFEIFCLCKCSWIEERLEAKKLFERTQNTMNKINMFWKTVILKRHLCFYNYVYQNHVGMILGLINSMSSPGICDLGQGHGNQGHDSSFGSSHLLTCHPLPSWPQCPLLKSVWPPLHWLWGLRLWVYLMDYNH